MRTELLPRERDLVRQVSTFGALSRVALRAMHRTLQEYGPLVMVSGPLTTGGRESFEANIEVFSETIQALQFLKIPVFDQTPFEPALQRLSEQPSYHEPTQLLEKFYLPLLESGCVRALYFISGWESSFGARWEYEQALRLRLGRVRLPVGFENDAEDC